MLPSALGFCLEMSLHGLFPEFPVELDQHPIMYFSNGLHGHFPTPLFYWLLLSHHVMVCL